jgi:hypothetical protein
VVVLGGVMSSGLGCGSVQAKGVMVVTRRSTGVAFVAKKSSSSEGERAAGRLEAEQRRRDSSCAGCALPRERVRLGRGERIRRGWRGIQRKEHRRARLIPF